MRVGLVALLASLTLAASAGAATGDVVVVSKPTFAPPAASFTAPAAGFRLQLESTTRREPALTYSEGFLIPNGVPASLDGRRAERSFLQPGTALIRYGASLIAGFGPRGTGGRSRHKHPTPLRGTNQ